MFNLSLCLLNEPYLPGRAGLDGPGGSSYIDCVILRQRDANSGWTSAADSTMEERRYYCQNWRADVSALITSGGRIVEWAKYTAYGIPFGRPGGDTDSDGDCDSTDITQIQTWIDAPAYDVRGDINLDGSVNATDKSLAISNYQGTTSGWNVLSAAVVANRIGYAGYQKDINLDIDHVRNRVYDPNLGRRTTRVTLAGLKLVNAYSVQPDQLHPVSEGVEFKCIPECKDDDYVRLAIDYVNESCPGHRCESWTVNCAMLLPEDGHTNCADCSIWIKRVPLDPAPCHVVAHELIHAGDMCQWGIGCDGPNVSDCSDLICSEIRASHRGCCQQFHDSRSDDYWKCLKGHFGAYRKTPCVTVFGGIGETGFEDLVKCCLPPSWDCSLEPIPPTNPFRYRGACPIPQ